MSVQAILTGQESTQEATTSKHGLMSAADKVKLDGIAQGATANVGTITGITMNGSSKGTSGVVNLGTVLTSHQDINGKENTSNKVTSISASSTDTQYPSAKAVYSEISSVKDFIKYPFDWGDESATADAQWFADLKTYLQSNDPNPNWVGKQKSVTLTSAVLGTTTHLIRCIGVNQDADRTVTFQTSNCLATKTEFSSLSSDSGNYANGTNYHHANNLIYDGNASGICKLYYDAFPGKASIKQVSKGTCLTRVSGQNGTATYTNQYVWIPSEGEVGLDYYASLRYSNWTTSNGECTQGKKFQYSYYNSNDNREKKIGDSGSASGWWTRGHFYNNTSNVCLVSLTGNASYDYYWYSRGAAPAFVIGN